MRDKILLFGFTFFLILGYSSTHAQPLIITLKGEYHNPGFHRDGYIRFGYAKGDVQLVWNDGLIQNFKDGGFVLRKPTEPGVYTVSIEGDFSDFEIFTSGWYFSRIDIVQWGNVELGRFYGASGAFSYSADSVIIKDINSPNLSNTTSLHSLFKPNGNNHLNEIYIDADFSNWNLSTIESLSFAFESTVLSNCSILNWDVSGVSYMNGTFKNAKNFNCNLNNWDVSNVEEMSELFLGAEAFNQNLNSWDVSKVTTMESMFQNATSFNSSINKWDVSSVTTMRSMFQGATSFNQSLNGWEMSNPDMSFMFTNANEFNGDISMWDVSNVSNMYGLFQGATSFNQSLNTWNVSNVGIMKYLFKDATSFNGDISNWDVSNVSNMYGLFQGATSFNQSLNTWNVSNVKYMSNMFSGSTSFNSNISDWDVSSVTQMSSMFRNASSFNQDISEWEINTSSISNMFQGALSFDQNLGNWNLSHARGLSGFLVGVTLSEQNYDSLLIGWSKQSLQLGQEFNAGYSIPTDSGRAARFRISEKFGWKITDGDGITVANEESDNNPDVFRLNQNYPNPFNPTTRISFGIPKTSYVTIGVYSSNGSLVKTLLDKTIPPGKHTLTFNASNLSSGTYFYRITTDSFTETRKMILVK